MKILLTKLLLCLSFGFLYVLETLGQQFPNIVFILADDLGYGSLNSYGASKDLIRTPHIDNLAEQGMRFTDAHTPASVCSPTRYGFITGQYPLRTRLQYGVINHHDPLLPDVNQVTIADWLKERGYNTAAIGKWHLGYGLGETGRRTDFFTWSPGPLDLGFDYHFGVPNNHGDLFNVYIENDQIYGLRTQRMHPYHRSFYNARQFEGFDAPQRKDVEVMDDLVQKSVEWIRSQSKDKPFFLYFAAVAVHHPVTPSEYMRGMSDAGPYGDFIQDLDRSVGMIVEALAYKGFLDNTLIIFASDNGGDIPVNRTTSPEMQAVDLGLKINGDLRADKHTIYEGGTRVPFIASWPGVIERNSVSHDLINVMDIFATVCEITDGRLPEDKNIAPDSFSFLPSLLGEENHHGRTSMVTSDVNGMLALRMGSWKYIDAALPDAFPQQRRDNIQSTLFPQLYNLDEDIGEQNNLYESNPDKAKQLKDELARIRRATWTR